MQDIEQLVSVGRELGACPYYGVRYAIPAAQVSTQRPKGNLCTFICIVTPRAHPQQEVKQSFCSSVVVVVIVIVVVVDTKIAKSRVLGIPASWK